MNRLLIAALLLLGTSSFSVGCRSCQSCHDYDPPVANCTCNHCGGTGRAGSVMGTSTMAPMEQGVTVMEEEQIIEYSE